MKDTKEIKEESPWDKKKIILFLIAVFAFIGIGYELKEMVLSINSPNSIKANVTSQANVKGASTNNFSPAQNFKQNIQNQINDLKDEASGINLIEIASSSPQVQKVIKDLKSLQNYPNDQLKDVCQKVCQGL